MSMQAEHVFCVKFIFHATGLVQNMNITTENEQSNNELLFLRGVQYYAAPSSILPTTKNEIMLWSVTRHIDGLKSPLLPHTHPTVCTHIDAKRLIHSTSLLCYRWPDFYLKFILCFLFWYSLI